MITGSGRQQLNRYLARQAGQFAGSLALGVGTANPTVNDIRLQYEVVRVPIMSINVDPNEDRIVFLAQVQPGQIKAAYEIGLWSSELDPLPAKTLGLLGASVPAVWTNGTLTNDNARANSNVLQVDYVANGTTSAELIGMEDDLSMFRDVDSVVIGYYVTANLSSLRVRMGSDASNYFELVLPDPVASSYNVARMPRSTATKTGSPDWASINYIAIRPSATASGGGSIYFDGIMFEPNSLSNTNLLVARSVLDNPHILDTSIASDIEYSLMVTVT